MSVVTAAAGQFAGVATSNDERAGAGLGRSVSAWRRVFEREQLAALDRFRSVAADDMRSAGADGATGGQRKCAVPVSSCAAVAPVRHASALAIAIAGAMPAEPGPEQHTGARATPATPALGPGAALCAGQALARALAAMELAYAPPAAATMLAPALALSGEWPWRKLHCMADADGIHVWLRDASLGGDDGALLEWIARLRAALAQSGARLASFTLNGIAISPIA